MAKRPAQNEIPLKGDGVEVTTDKKLISLGDDYLNAKDEVNNHRKTLRETEAEILNRMNVLGLKNYRVGDKLFRDNVKHSVKVATVKGEQPEPAMEAPTERGA